MQNQTKLRSAIFKLPIVLLFAYLIVFPPSAPAASAEMYLSMGQGYMSKGNFDMAVHAFEKAVELSPDWPEAHNALGESYIKLLRFEDAVAEFDRALELKPGYSQAEKNRRSAMTAVKQYRPVKASRLRTWHKFAIIGGVTAAIAVISALIVQSLS